MEKKVLLKDLVDSGTHIRKQIVSKVRVTDEGVYPIGELWDANTTLDVIVNGAHSQHDTIREVDTFAHDLDTKKVGRITVDDIQNIPASKLDLLKAGDIVIKTTGEQTHAYTVAYKKDDEASLVYADHENIEEVYYEKQSGVWTYVQTDNMPLQSIPTNVSTFNNDAGYITEHQDLSSIISRIEALEIATGINQEETPL